MKKIIAVFLAISVLISFFSFTATAVQISYKPLTSLKKHTPDNIEYASYSMSYEYNGKKQYLPNRAINEDEIKFLLDFFNEENLTYSDEAFTDDVRTSIPNAFDFWTNSGEDYLFLFNSEGVYAFMRNQTDIIDKPERYSGKYLYKSPEAYGILTDFLDTITKRFLDEKEYKEQNPESYLENVVRISNFEILYKANFTVAYETNYTWGICKYLRQGDSKETISGFFITESLNDLKYNPDFTIAEDLVNNRIILKHKRSLCLYDDEVTGYEYDTKATYTHTFDFSINVDENMQADSVVMTAVHYLDQTPRVKTILAKDIKQEGKLPSEYFSVGNSSESTATEEEITNSDTPLKSDGDSESEEILKPPVTEPGEELKNEDIEKNETEEKKPDENEAEEKEEIKDSEKTEEANKDEELSEEIKSDGLSSITPKECADTLYELGLFKGTDKGYELDSPLTREQAATTLVRLLGEKKNIDSISYDEVFEDVTKERWSFSYVMYCYENKITKGTGQNSFSPERTIPADEYITLVMRLLGYTDTEPSNALENAVSAGLIGEETAAQYERGAEFKRADMVYVMYQSLSTKTTNGKLLSQILKDKNVIA